MCAFSSPRGGRQSSARSASPKKERRKKQEFHTHKAKLEERLVLDAQGLQERVVNSLRKLGQQRFTEDSPYGLRDWLNSFNFLLDDFERKAPSGELPEAYFGKRKESEALLLKPIDLGEFNKRIQALRQQEDDLGVKIEMVKARENMRKLMEPMKVRRDEINKELGVKMARISELAQQRRERKFFTKLIFGEQRNPEEDDLRAAVEKLQSELKQLDIKLANYNPEPYAARLQQEDTEYMEKLKEIKTQLDQLRFAKVAKSQLVEEREKAASMMSEAISKISFANLK